MTRGLPTILIALVAFLAACGRPPEETAAPAGDTSAMEPPPAVELAQPDTTGEALWAWLVEQQYAETWERWPGTTPLYPGTEPHGALLTTYVNPAARGALRRGDESMPPGAVVVKENYLSDSTLAAVTVMLQARGYDPAHQDWFWAKYGSAGEIEAAGRVEGCAGCHGGEPDYLFSGDLGAPAPADSVIGDAP